jgi:heterodisulfide reductase subunit A
LDEVVSARVGQFMCGTEGRRMIAEVVEGKGLDRMVIGACSRRFQGPTFERVARELRLGDNTVAFANLREGCSFVHRHEPALAQRKAERILAAAVARAAQQAVLPRGRTFLHRSALVVGGGIAGLSAAEELAEAGIDVHLVEREQSLGGQMARLAKTFPTEDCAMCSLAPRLTAVAVSSRVKVHALTDVAAVTGSPGEFRVTLRHRPSFVTDACVSCGDCTEVCPVQLRSGFDFGLAGRPAIWRPFANAVPRVFAIERRGTSPCSSACPLGTAAQGYTALVAARRFEEAYRLITERNPFPSVCGRICAHPCEQACTRSEVDAPVALRALKRFVGDRVGPEVQPERVPPAKQERVAVIGAGPAGLTCSRELVQLGYPTTVYEASPEAGGMLRYGVPDYRLPKHVLAREVSQVEASGVEIRLGQRAGSDFTVDELFEHGYSAVFIAAGLQASARLEVAGAGLKGVVDAVGLLRRLNSGKPVELGQRVVVIGGGDVAIDAARAALRLQRAAGHEPDVTIAYRRSRAEMPAGAEVVSQALEEGARLECLVSPVEVTGRDGTATGVRFQRCELAGPGKDGRRHSVALEGAFVELAAGTVITALGQELVPDFLTGCSGVVVEDGRVRSDQASLMTDRAGVFAAGDAATRGPLTAIDAIAAGRRAALSIDAYLRGTAPEELAGRREAEARPAEEVLRSATRRERAAVPVLSGAVRAKGWDEVELGLGEEEAVAEASRCLACAGCSSCGSCVPACPAGAIDLTQQPWDEEVVVGAVVVTTGHKEFDASRKFALGFGRHANVITQSQLARLLSASGPTGGELRRPSDGTVPRSVLMLQCVGSRDCSSSGNSHCSAVCCLVATVQASLIVQHHPGATVTVAYTDLRAPGKAHEEYLRLVQQRGVRYLRGRTGELLEEPDGSLRARLENTLTGQKSEEVYDLVVLSAGLEGSTGTTAVARALGLQQDAAGFLREYHPKLRPVDTQRAGVFVAGTAQGPKNIPDSITQAKAAAARVVSLLQAGYATTPSEVARVDARRCVGCGTCALVCPQGALSLVGRGPVTALPDPGACSGCGICAAECPAGAISVGGFSDAEVLAEALA